MTLSIRDPQADRLAREIAEKTGKPITTVVKEALAQYAEALPPPAWQEKLRKIEAIVEEIRHLPVRDPRSAKEIMDDLYDEHGLPK